MSVPYDEDKAKTFKDFGRNNINGTQHGKKKPIYLIAHHIETML